MELTEEQIIEWNMLLARFMGGKDKTEKAIGIPDKHLWLPFHGICRFDTIQVGKGPTLQYHRSWDWLMDVVEKIESLGYEAQITSSWSAILLHNSAIYLVNIYSVDGPNKLTATYRAIVEFVKWYNNRK